jgi:hypothetical protein
MTRLPSSFVHSDEGGATPVPFIVIGIVAGLALICAVGMVWFCRRRKQRKAESMANAFQEFAEKEPDSAKKSTAVKSDTVV